MAKSKVVKFDVKEPFEGKSSAFVAFEDKAWGFYEYTGESIFGVGDEVEYSIETKATTKKDGTKGKDVKIVTIAEPPSKTALQQSKNIGEQLSDKFADPAYFKQPKSYDEMKCDLRVAILQSLGVIVAAGKIEPKEITTYFNDIYPALDLSIDDLSK